MTTLSQTLIDVIASEEIGPLMRARTAAAIAEAAAPADWLTRGEPAGLREGAPRASRGRSAVGAGGSRGPVPAR